MLSLGNTYKDPITISTRNGSSMIRTFAGDDTIAGGCSSTCSIDGGYGVNTIVYAGNRANYSITRTANGYTIKDKVGTDGTDNVKNIQLLKFADTAVDLRTGVY